MRKVVKLINQIHPKSSFYLSYERQVRGLQVVSREVLRTSPEIAIDQLYLNLRNAASSFNYYTIIYLPEHEVEERLRESDQWHEESEALLTIELYAILKEIKELIEKKKWRELGKFCKRKINSGHMGNRDIWKNYSLALTYLGEKEAAAHAMRYSDKI